MLVLLLINYCLVSSALPTTAVNTGIPNCTPDLPLLTNSESLVTDHEPVSSKTDMLTDQSLSESRALIPTPVPATNVEALTAVSVNQKFQKPELAQHRIWRPFSIPEVEALVQAVEEIGTGRYSISCCHCFCSRFCEYYYFFQGVCGGG